MISLEDFDHESSILDVHRAEFSLAAYRFLHLYKKTVELVDEQMTWIKKYRPRNKDDEQAKALLQEALAVWHKALRETSFDYLHFDHETKWKDAA